MAQDQGGGQPVQPGNAEQVCGGQGERKRDCPRDDQEEHDSHAEVEERAVSSRRGGAGATWGSVARHGQWDVREICGKRWSCGLFAAWFEVTFSGRMAAGAHHAGRDVQSANRITET